MRRTDIESDRARVLGSPAEAHHEAVPAKSPAARTTSLSPETVSAAPVPPAPAAGTAAPERAAPGAPVPRGWFGRGQLVVITALVAVTSLATALVVVQGSRQLGSAPREATTPYLAVEPSGPIRLPEAAAPPGAGAASDVSSPGTPPEAPATVAETTRRTVNGTGPSRTRPRDRAEPPAPPLRSPESAPAGPDAGTPPKFDEPPEADEPPRVAEPDRRCKAAAAHSLVRCVVDIAGLSHRMAGSSRPTSSGAPQATPGGEARGQLSPTADAPGRAGPS